MALDEAYFTNEKYIKLRELAGTTLKLLNGYINYLKPCASSGVPTINNYE